MKIRCTLALLAAALLAILSPPANCQQKETLVLTLATDIAALMPRHGIVSTQAASQWEDALVAGSGTMGALLYGDPCQGALIADHLDRTDTAGKPNA